MQLHNVIYAPALNINLLSGFQLRKKGFRVVIGEEGEKCPIEKGGKVFGELIPQNNLFFVDLVEITANVVRSKLNPTPRPKPLKLWHRRLGHLSFRAVKKLQDWADGIKILTDPEDDDGLNNRPCEACIKGKQAKRPLKGRGNPYRHSNEPFDLVHTDICQPLIPGYDGSRYFVTFTDDYTRVTFVKRLKKRSELYEAFKSFCRLIKTQFNVTVKRIRSDNEYNSNRLQKFMDKEGMLWEPTVAYNPHENGVSERVNRTLLDKIRSILADSDLPRNLWPELLETAAYLKMRTPTRFLKNLTPFERLFNRKPDLSHLRVIGCQAWAQIPEEKRSGDKLDFRSQDCRLIGYAASTQFVLYEMESKRIIYSRDVVFDEESHKSRPSGDAIEIRTDDNAEDENSSSRQLNETPTYQIDQSDEISPIDDLPEPEEEQDETNFFRVNIPDEGSFSTFGRRIMPSRRLQEARANCLTSGSTLESEKGSNGGKQTNKGSSLTTMLAFEIAKARSQLIPSGQLPESYEEAINSADRIQWEKAMEDEYDSLLENNTWILVSEDEIPADRQILSGKWVFRIKKISKDPPEPLELKYKARWVVKGFQQKQGLDYFETFAAVAKPASYKILLALAAHYGFLAYQMDVKTAFLNGTLQEDIYMRLPKGFEDRENNRGTKRAICKLMKTLYGLKQAPRTWANVLYNFLRDFGLQRLETDHCIFTGRGLIVAIYVDDLLIIVDDMQSYKNLKSELENRFKMTDMGLANRYLGIEIHQSTKSITITQTAFIEEILHRFGMENCAPKATPMNNSLRLDSEFAGDLLDEESKERYQSAVGSLIYLMLGTRPDISFAVSILSRFTAFPRTKHEEALHHLFRYLRATPKIGITYRSKDSDPIPFGFTDANFGGTIVRDDRRSTSAYVMMLSGGAVSWSTKRQPTVSTSSTEAEYIGQFNAAREATWIRLFLEELGFGDLVQKATTIYADSNGARALAENPTSHSKAKHMEIKYYWQRQQVEHGVLRYHYVPSKQNAADGLTSDIAGTCS